MGFLDTLGEFAGKAVSDMQKKMERIQQYKDMYECYDDRKLINEYKKSSGEKKMAITQLLKERGYGNSN